MSDYAQQTIDLYKSIVKVDKIRNASTPFLPEGSLTPSGRALWQCGKDSHEVFVACEARAA